MVGIHFDNNEDFELFYDHCSDLISNRDSTNLADHASDEEMDSLQEDLDKWYADFEETGSYPDALDCGEFWIAVISFFDDNHTIDEWKKEDSKITFPSGHEKSGRPIGYSDELISSQLLSQASLIKHRYRTPPPPISWELRTIKPVQNDDIAYIGIASICEIDAIGSVPWLDPRMSSHTFGKKALDPNEMRNQWQRVVDRGRITNIKGFANNPNHSLFNPIILYVDKSSPYVELNHRGRKANLQINFDFLKKTGSKDRTSFTDYIVNPTEKDLRPIWIIDGQHRTRGYAISHLGHEINVPIIVIPGEDNEDSRTKVAKIFTQINTEAKPIEDLHQIFLRYKFSMKGGRNNNFERDDHGDPTIGQNGSRPLIRAYELALNLSSDPDSPLYNTIKFQKPPGRKDSKHQLVDVKGWMTEITKLFRSNKVYQDISSDSFHLEEMKNYFISFAETCNKSSWPCDEPSGWDDKLNRWFNPPGSRTWKPLLQQAGPFQVLLQLFNDLVNYMAWMDTFDADGKFLARAEDPSIHRPLSIEDFRNAMEPIENIDWRRPDVRSGLSGRMSNVPYVKDWIMTAIRNKKVYSEFEVNSDNIPSTPGQGILSVPKSTKIRKAIEGQGWFTANQIELYMERPVHAQKVLWDVTYYTSTGENERQLEIPKRWIKTDNARSTLTLQKQDFSEAANHETISKIIIKGRWNNWIGNSQFSTKTFENPRLR
ncbi:MAG: DGQHR domain-containing protein [Candidatus Thalassarchaeaceae archaeon]